MRPRDGSPISWPYPVALFFRPISKAGLKASAKAGFGKRSVFPFDHFVRCGNTLTAASLPVAIAL